MAVEIGNVEETILEDKVTLYRLHPNQKEHFGLIMTAPNIPNIPSKMKEYAKRGCKLNPQNLAPDCEIKADPNGELWAVPKGWKIVGEEVDILYENRDGDMIPRGKTIRYKLAQAKSTETPKGLACDVCGKACASEFGLRVHKRTHK